MLTTTFIVSVVPAVLVTPVLPLLSSTAATVVSLVTSSSFSRRLTRRFLLSWRPSLVRAVSVVVAVVALEDAVVVVLPFAMCAWEDAEVVGVAVTAAVVVVMEVLQEEATVAAAAGVVLLLSSPTVEEVAATLAVVAAVTATPLVALVAPPGGREPSWHSHNGIGIFNFFTSRLTGSDLLGMVALSYDDTMERRCNSDGHLVPMEAGIQDTEKDARFHTPCLSASFGVSGFVFTLHDTKSLQKWASTLYGFFFTVA